MEMEKGVFETQGNRIKTIKCKTLHKHAHASFQYTRQTWAAKTANTAVSTLFTNSG